MQSEVVKTNFLEAFRQGWIVGSVWKQNQSLLVAFPFTFSIKIWKNYQESIFRAKFEKTIMKVFLEQ